MKRNFPNNYCIAPRRKNAYASIRGTSGCIAWLSIANSSTIIVEGYKGALTILSTCIHTTKPKEP